MIILIVIYDVIVTLLGYASPMCATEDMSQHACTFNTDNTIGSIYDLYHCYIMN